MSWLCSSEGVDGDLLQAATPSFSNEQRNAPGARGHPGAGKKNYRVSGLVQQPLGIELSYAKVPPAGWQVMSQDAVAASAVP